MECVKLLNIKVLSLSKTELLKELKEGVVYTPNLDHLVKLQQDKDFYAIYQKAEWVVCDSKILYLFSKLLKHSIKEVIPGSNFFPTFYNYHRNDPD